MRNIYKLVKKSLWVENCCCSNSKGSEVDLYSAFIVVGYLTLKALRYGSHSVTYKSHRTCLYLVSIYQMEHPQTEVADI